MPAIKSLEELKRVRDEALQKKKMKAAPGNVQVIVAMGSCGIAAGARETMKSALKFIESKGLSGVTVTQTGCIGMCAQEPIVQVAIGGEPTVAYGRVNSEVAQQIMKQHVQNGIPVKDYVLPLRNQRSSLQL